MVRIVSQYVNEGAYGGGTSKEDYSVKLTRPFLHYFKIVTPIDTLTINLREWRKPDHFHLDDINGLWYMDAGYNPMNH